MGWRQLCCSGDIRALKCDQRHLWLPFIYYEVNIDLESVGAHDFVTSDLLGNLHIVLLQLDDAWLIWRSNLGWMLPLLDSFLHSVYVFYFCKSAEHAKGVMILHISYMCPRCILPSSSKRSYFNTRRIQTSFVFSLNLHVQWPSFTWYFYTF